MAPAVEKALVREYKKSQDPFVLEQLLKAAAKTITRQANYVVWRDGVVVHGGDRKSKSKLQIRKLDLPPADPGVDIIHRWRKRLCVTKAKRNAD